MTSRGYEMLHTNVKSDSKTFDNSHLSRISHFRCLEPRIRRLVWCFMERPTRRLKHTINPLSETSIELHRPVHSCFHRPIEPAGFLLPSILDKILMTNGLLSKKDQSFSIEIDEMSQIRIEEYGGGEEIFDPFELPAFKQ
ncbi:hypothetical protein L596_016336 [Steinernema carpocapsae]|uniref:Uncharacterized protein n=1 Tax=Steinernema carpocapsae TaxID=34508 RepID=A0A4V6A3D1_STECR|nr:hypothetical protein L596_016336 [Steinernema carpocapsae]